MISVVVSPQQQDTVSSINQIADLIVVDNRKHNTGHVKWTGITDWIDAVMVCPYFGSLYQISQALNQNTAAFCKQKKPDNGVSCASGNFRYDTIIWLNRFIPNIPIFEFANGRLIKQKCCFVLQWVWGFCDGFSRWTAIIFRQSVHSSICTQYLK